MSIAKIADGVVESVDHTRDAPPEGWVKAPSSVVPGQLYQGGQFSNPVPLVVDAESCTINQLLDELSQRPSTDPAFGDLEDQLRSMITDKQRDRLIGATRGILVKSHPMIRQFFIDTLGWTEAQYTDLFNRAAAR